MYIVECMNCNFINKYIIKNVIKRKKIYYAL